MQVKEKPTTHLLFMGVGDLLTSPKLEQQFYRLVEMMHEYPELFQGLKAGIKKIDELMGGLLQLMLAICIQR